MLITQILITSVNHTKSTIEHQNNAFSRCPNADFFYINTLYFSVLQNLIKVNLQYTRIRVVIYPQIAIFQYMYRVYIGIIQCVTRHIYSKIAYIKGVRI